MGHDQQRKPQYDDPTGTATAAPLVSEELSQSWDFVKDFAKSGKGSQKNLPRHVSQLGAFAASAVSLMPDIAKHASGETILECASILAMPLADSLHVALGAKPKLSTDAMREFLRRQSAETLGDLDKDPALIDAIRKVMKGPLSIEIPELGSISSKLFKKKNLIKWYVETTDPTIVALEFAGNSFDAGGLAPALDAIAPTTPQAWGWLDHLHVAPGFNIGYGIVGLRDKATNPLAKPKLEALAKQFVEDMGERQKGEPQAQKDLAVQVKGTDDNAFLDAAARAQGNPNLSDAEISKRLMGASPDVVLEYCATGNSYTDGRLLVQLGWLENAKGGKTEHLRKLLRSSSTDEVFGALKDDKARKQIRTMAGKDVSLHELMSHDDLENAHAKIVRDDALRQWAYEDKTPRSRLWIAAGSGAGAKDGCRLVKSEKGNDWVKQLPRDVDSVQLRRFVLNTNDAAMAAWVKANLLHDAAHKVDEDDSRIVETSGIVYGQAAKLRLDVATSPKSDADDPAMRSDPQAVLARLADLNAGERAAIVKSKTELAALFEDLRGYELRAVYLLQPTLPQLVNLPIANVRELVDYAGTRPAAEEIEAAQQATNAHRVFGKVSPFIALPLLRDPKTLAEALDDNVELLDWIIATTEPNQAIGLLSRDPARKVVASLMGERATAWDGLPAFENLRKDTRAAFASIAKEVKSEGAKEELGDYQDGNVETSKDLDERATTFKDASRAENLWEGIDKLYEAGVDKADLVALVQRSSPAEQAELLGTGHETTVRHLQQRTQLAPQHVFIDLDVSQLLKLPASATWLLGVEQPFVVLSLIGPMEAAAALGVALRKNKDVAKTFIKGLPRGANLTPAERLTLDQVGRFLTQDAELLRLLFGARFDVPLTATYDEGETHHLWRVLERLPPAQVNQHVMRAFTEQSLNGPVGQWDPGNRTIDLEANPKVLEGNDHHYNRDISLSVEDVKKYYGLDDKALKAASDPTSGWLVFENGKYHVKPVNPKQFDSTVLHEVGHTIDTLLGEQTELIYGLAGWKRYGFDQFETWANEMGAFENVNGTDRSKIVDVWQQSLRSKTAVSKLVGADHPAMKNKKSPLGKYVDEDAPFAHNDHKLQPVNDRVFLNTPTSLASVKKQAWDNAPTDYAMTAPAEYFAECYAEYYCAYDGTATTESKKGGRLPNWIKKWFDEHVDKIRFNPQRVRGPKADNI